MLGNKDGSTLTYIDRLGLLLKAEGKLDEAKPLFEEVLTGKRETLGDKHPSTLPSINNLGFLLRAEGKLDEAGRCSRRRSSGGARRSGISIRAR